MAQTQPHILVVEDDRETRTLIATVPGDEAFRPLDKGGCPLVK